MTIDEFHKIIDFLRRLIAGTKFEGKVFAVGGCTRDEALGLKEVKDIDLAVELPNGGLKFASWLRKRHLTLYSPVRFERYGTAMLRLKAFLYDEIEIVQTRCGKYSGIQGSDPAEMFGTVDRDCRLRDLTINSLYLNVSSGELVDPSGMALDDIKAHRLRTPDDPEKVLLDDPVRILRVIRFACSLGWKISPEMLKAMKDTVGLLNTVTVERVRAEVEKMFSGPDPVRALNLLEDIGALAYVFPELEEAQNFPLEDGSNLYRHLRATFEKASARDCSLPVRLAALYHDIGKLETRKTNEDGGYTYSNHESKGTARAAKALRRLKIHPSTVKEVSFLVQHHHFPGPEELPSEYRALKRLRKLQRECRTADRLESLLSLMSADAAATGNTRPNRIEWMRSQSEKMQREHTDGFTGTSDEPVKEPHRKSRKEPAKEAKDGKNGGSVASRRRKRRRQRRRRQEQEKKNSQNKD